MPWKGFQDSLPTHEQLDELFAGHPEADGLGILTTGLVIIDEDVMEDGSANPFPNDPTVAPYLSSSPAVRTPSGGIHRYFRAPAGVRLKNSVGVLAPKVDIRAEGGFLMVPPSVRMGTPYTWLRIQPLAVPLAELPELPASILARLTTDPTPRIEAGPKSLLDPIYEGERNDTLFRQACRWRRGGLIECEILALLQLHNDLRCSPTLRDNDLAAIARSVSSYPIRGQELIALGHVDGDGKPIGLKVLSATEFKRIPPPTFVIDRVLPSGVIVLFAIPGLGKSFLCLAFGSSIARNVPLFGNAAFKVNRPGWVLFILPEGVASWAGRVRSYDCHHFYDDSPNMQFINDGINVYDDRGWALLRMTVDQLTDQRGEPPTLIIVDTLASATPGANENAIEDMGLVMSRLQSLVKSGSNVLLVHHANKAGDYRGHSAIKGSCDAMLQLTKDESTGILELVSNKLRDADRIDPCAFEIRATNDGAVPIGTTKSGPWGRLKAAWDQHPGLEAALRAHGFVLPGEGVEPDAEQGFQNGVTPRAIQSSWNASSPPDSKAQRAARTRALLRIVQDLAACRLITVGSGTLKGKQADALDAVIRQVTPP